MYRSIDPTRIRNLKVVAKLKQGQKLRTRFHHYSIDDHGVISLQSFLRWAAGESRAETIESLTGLIESCVTQHGLEPEEKVRLANQFKNVAGGIRNLAVTYKDDITACAGLELIMEAIDDYIARHGEDLEEFEEK